MSADAAMTIDNDAVSTANIPMFKTERGYTINITALARAARDSIQSVELITVPSVVRKQQRRGEECESPTMSEIGGGTECDFCQVIAGADGRPVSIDEVVFVNSDPGKARSNHGTAVISGGSFFAIGWKRPAESVILIYRVINVEELLENGRPAFDRAVRDREPRPVAKLTCELVGNAMSTWRGRRIDVPDELMSLFSTVELRMITDFHIPLYMDVIRMMPGTSESQAVAESMKTGGFGPVEECGADDFMTKVYQEIIDIRRVQYEQIPEDGKRRVEPLRAVQTIELDRENNTITVELVIPRADDTMPVQYRVVLTPENYTDNYGRVVLERGLVLRCPTFERFRSELESRRDSVVVVNLASIR